MRIIWHKWIDPVASMVLSGDSDENDDDELQAKHDSLYGPNDSKWHQAEANMSRLGPCVMGPNGIIPLHESTLPSKLYNFWIGHTDFDLRVNGYAALLASVPGVETIDFFTRYRFRVAIAKAFNQDAVKASMEKVIRPVKPPQKAGLDAMKRLLSEQYPCWAIYVMPTGKVEVASGANQDEVLSKGEAYRKDAKEIISSWM